MAQYIATSPNGKKYTINAPEGATDEDLYEYVQNHIVPQEGYSAAQSAQQSPQQQPADNSSNSSSFVPKDDPSIWDQLGALKDAVVNPDKIGWKPENWQDVKKDLYGYGAAASQGLFNLGDEILAGAGTVASKANILNDKLSGTPDEYEKRLADVRAIQEDFKARYPAQAAVGNISGGVLATAPLMGAKALSLIGKIPGATAVGNSIKAINNPLVQRALPLATEAAEATAMGAGMGAGYGFGEGTNLSDRLDKAGKEAATFGAIAGAFPLAAAGGGALLRGGGRLAKNVAGAGMGVAGDALQFLQDLYNPKQAAFNRVAQAIKDDASNVPLDELMQRVNAGKSLVEAGGENVVATADALAQQPGAARAFAKNKMEEILAQQRDDMASMVKEKLGATGEGTNANALAQAMNERIRPLADAAFNPSPEVLEALKNNQIVNTILNNPDAQTGISNYLRILRNKLASEGNAFNKADYNIENIIVDPATGKEKLIFGQSPTMKMYDAVNRSFNSILDSNEARNQFGRLNEYGASVAAMKNAYRKAVADAHPAWGKYLKTASDEYSKQEAAKLGRKLFSSSDKEEMIDRLNGLSDTDKQIALEGAVRTLFEDIQRRPDEANAYIGKLNKEYFRDLLTPLVENPQQINELAQELGKKAQSFRNINRMLNQSATQMRSNFGAANNTLTQSAISKAIDKLSRTDMRTNMAEILFDGKNDDAKQIVQKLYERSNKQRVADKTFMNHPYTKLTDAEKRRLLLAGFYNTTNGDKDAN